MTEIIKFDEIKHKEPDNKPDITTLDVSNNPKYIEAGIVYCKCSNCGAEAGFKFSIQNEQYVNIPLERILNVNPIHICGNVGSCTEIGKYEVTHMVLFDWIKRIVSGKSVIYTEKLPNKMVNDDTTPYSGSNTYLCNYLKPGEEPK